MDDDAEDTRQPDEVYDYADRDEPDVLLDVPQLKVDEITLDVEELRARVSLRAEVLELLRLNVGADVSLGGVHLDIKGVEAQALLKVRLDHVAEVIGKVLTTIDRNPQILEQITSGVGGAAQELGRGAGHSVDELGRGAGRAAEDIGASAGDVVGEAGEAVGGAGDRAGRAVGETAGTVRDTGSTVRDTAGEAAPEADGATAEADRGAAPAARSADGGGARDEGVAGRRSRIREPAEGGRRSRRTVERTDRGTPARRPSRRRDGPERRPP